ncbi:MAG: hypothetical protein DRQ78_03045 [Epsilonproteobacteria bacterium]|nr:MAG: hypothetical protein DRQ78_03045 [Campylobacterota bacterium]
MKIKLSLIDKNFFFLDGLNIVKGEEQEIDLAGQSDTFIASIASSIAVGILKSETTHSVLIGLIKENNYREVMARRLRVDLSKTQDVIETKPVITNIVVEEIPEPEPEPEVEEAPKDTNDEELYSLLKGSNRSVSSKIKDADLSSEDKSKLLKAEEDGRNRAVVKKLLSA